MKQRIKREILVGIILFALIGGGLFYVFSKNNKPVSNTSENLLDNNNEAVNDQDSHKENSNKTEGKGGAQTADLSASDYLENAQKAYQEKNLDEALTNIQASISKEPSAEAYNLWGNILRDQGKVNEAKEKYQKTISLNPHYVAAYLNLSAIYQDENNLGEAEAILENGLIANPENSDLQNALDVLNLTPTSGN